MTNVARVSSGGPAPLAGASAGSGHDVGVVEGLGSWDPPGTFVNCQVILVGVEGLTGGRWNWCELCFAFVLT